MKASVPLSSLKCSISERSFIFCQFGAPIRKKKKRPFIFSFHHCAETAVTRELVETSCSEITVKGRIILTQLSGMFIQALKLTVFLLIAERIKESTFRLAMKSHSQVKAEELWHILSKVLASDITLQNLVLLSLWAV